jgi:hypothetical protein
VISVTATADDVRRHDARFAAKQKRRRRSTPNLKAQVLELHRRGIVPAAIADQINVSDRRVADIIRDAA